MNTLPKPAKEIENPNTNLKKNLRELLEHHLEARKQTQKRCLEMEKKELGGAPRNNWLQELNKNSESDTENGQKHQLPVRFESETLELIEGISRRNGFSKAEAVRRLVCEGIDKLLPNGGNFSATG